MAAAMRILLPLVVSLSVAAVGFQSPGAVVLDNAQVRVFRTAGASRSGVEHGPGVVVPLDHPDRTAWADDAAVETGGPSGPLIIVEPKHLGKPAPSAEGSQPGQAPFVGMSFKTLFEHDNVTVLKARMDVGAREGFHTHGSDTVVVHLSGGAIEDTANGTTKVNRWKHGDVEFEALGSSHSARNVGQAVDVILVALGPTQ
jgi:quercetin dioxygenase-like cupin family protein